MEEYGVVCLAETRVSSGDIAGSWGDFSALQASHVPTTQARDFTVESSAVSQTATENNIGTQDPVNSVNCFRELTAHN